MENYREQVPPGDQGRSSDLAMPDLGATQAQRDNPAIALGKLRAEQPCASVDAKGVGARHNTMRGTVTILCTSRSLAS